MSNDKQIEDARAKLLAYRTGVTSGGSPHPVKSLRALAREIKMSPTGLAKFLQGAEPYTPIRRRILAWYARQEADDSPARVDHLIALLSEEFAPEHRAAAAYELRATFDRISQALAQPAPGAVESPAAEEDELIPSAPPPRTRAPAQRAQVGKRYTVVTVRCPECDVDVVASRFRSHMWTVHGIRGVALP